MLQVTKYFYYNSLITTLINNLEFVLKKIINVVHVNDVIFLITYINVLLNTTYLIQLLMQIPMLLESLDKNIFEPFYLLPSIKLFELNLSHENYVPSENIKYK